MFLAKNEKSANSFREAMSSDEVNKEYICRVRGDFRNVGGEVIVKKWVYIADYKKMLHDCEDQDKLT